MDKQTFSDEATALLAWTAPVRPTHERSHRWYLSGAVFVLLITIYSIIIGVWSFALVMILIAGMYVLSHSSKETEKSIAITNQGIVFDQRFTAYHDLENFWMLQAETYIELHIAQKKRGPEIVIQLGREDPRIVRALLGKYLTERSDQTEKLLDTIIRICKL